MQSPTIERIPHLADQSLRVLTWDRDLIDMHCLDAAGRAVPYRGQGSTWHQHRAIELTLLTSGSSILAVGDHIGRSDAPDCLLLGSDLPHVWSAAGRMAGVSLQLEPEGPLAQLPEWAALAGLFARARAGVRLQGAAARAVRRTLIALPGLPALPRLARVLALLADIHSAVAADASAACTLASRPSPIPRPSASEAGLQRVIDTILQHPERPLALGQAVALAGMSQATFCRRFQARTGRSFVQYLTAVRLQRVRWALARTDQPITAIAGAAGFHNLAHFHACFRAAEGCTPRAFRRRCRAEDA